MANNYYPIGNSTFKEALSKWGHYLDIDELFGICYAEITAPEDMYAPFLLIRYNNKTIAPTGSWKGWYCSEELKLAIKYGYTVKVDKAYHYYNKANIFNKYINTLFNNRLLYDKSDPKNLSCTGY